MLSMFRLLSLVVVDMARKEDRGTFVVGLVERLLPELEEDQREFF